MIVIAIVDDDPGEPVPAGTVAGIRQPEQVGQRAPRAEVEGARLARTEFDSRLLPGGSAGDAGATFIVMTLRFVCPCRRFRLPGNPVAPLAGVATETAGARLANLLERRSSLVTRTAIPASVPASVPTSLAPHRTGRFARLASAVLVALLLAACGGPAPSATPVGSPSSSVLPGASAAPSGPPASPSGPPASLDPRAWVRAPNIEEPDGFMTAQTGVVITRGCAPCHPAIDTLMTGVTAGPAGLLAVGWILQDFSGASWRSSDGATWTFTGGFPTQTLLAAVASNDQRYVAVGRDGNGATAWTSTDALTWQKVASPSFSLSPLRLTSIVAWKGGFVAGGYKGNEFLSADAALWSSPDGLTWQRTTDAAEFHDARVWGVAAGPNGLVAVGQAGPADAPGAAVVWTSSDGRTWSRVPDGPAFHDGRMRAVASVPGIGFVAVGEDLAGDTGIIWVSKDGRQWERAPSDPSLGRPGIQVRIYAVTSGPNGAIAAGTIDTGVQYGQAEIWTSSDGRAWKPVPTGPEFLDNEVSAATRWNDRVVAVGDRGAPDAYQATAWLSPSGVGR